MSPLEIKLLSKPTCPVCGDSGETRFDCLVDRLFDVKGQWILKKCVNHQCETHWLDPAPHPDYLYKLYEAYSTHVTANIAPPLPDTLPVRIQRSYLQHRYGYDQRLKGYWKRLWWLAYIYPAWKDMQDTRVFYIPYRSNADFLDVGCGNGNAMISMRSLGWRVHGIDTDDQAVIAGKKMGLEIDCGTLDSVKYPDSSFDAILLTNVIEHVPNPQETLKECYRILRPGGSITLITPNGGGLGLVLFGKNWRGLETPQHLQIFTKNSLATLCSKAGYTQINSFTSPHSDFYILQQSLTLSKYAGHVSHETKPPNTLLAKLARRILSVITGYLNFIFDRSEAIVVTARKS